MSIDYARRILPGTATSEAGDTNVIPPTDNKVTSDREID